MDDTRKNLLCKIPEILGILICIILAPIIVMNVTIIVKSYLNPDKVPDFFGIKPFVVNTDSMKGVFSGGDLIVTKAVEPQVLQIGDIISYKERNAVITHRIIELTEKDENPMFVTKGDANDAEDANAVSYGQIEGVYLFKVQKIGHLAMFMQTPMGMLIFICIPVCGLALFDTICHKFSTRKDKEISDC